MESLEQLFVFVLICVALQREEEEKKTVEISSFSHYLMCLLMMFADSLGNELKLLYCTEQSLAFGFSLQQPHLGESCLT